MWAGALMGPPGARRRIKPRTMSCNPTRKVRCAKVTTSEMHLSCCAVWQCVYVLCPCRNSATCALSGCLREDLCRPCGDVHSAVKTSFKNTRRHKNNHSLNCINTHTVAPRSRGAAGTNKPCNFSTGIWLSTAAEFPYVCNLMNEEFSGGCKGGNL